MKRLMGLVLVLMVLLMGCEDGQREISEKASLEGKAAADQQIKAESEIRASRAAEMESDLATRQRLYQAISGTYEGKLRVGNDEFLVRVTLTSSLAPFSSPRARAVEEIVSDLNNLYLNAVLVKWSEGVRDGFGCVFENVRPDMKRGVINLVSEKCPTAYYLSLSDGGMGAMATKEDSMSVAKVSAALSSNVLAGKQEQVDAFVGRMISTKQANTWKFALRRLAD